jgi:hypothetical protein
VVLGQTWHARRWNTLEYKVVDACVIIGIIVLLPISILIMRYLQCVGSEVCAQSQLLLPNLPPFYLPDGNGGLRHEVMKPCVSYPPAVHDEKRRW